MTIPWVMKRTELVLKCLKGFMMEMGTWGTNRCSTIQLVVPKVCFRLKILLNEVRNILFFYIEFT